MEGQAKLRAELSHALGDITSETRYDPNKKMGWFDWMNMDIEEHAAVKKRMKEESVLDSLPKSQRVPNKFAPTFMSMLCSGILATVHLLVVLLQVWSVKFNVWMNYWSVNATATINAGSDYDDGSQEVQGLDIPEEWMELDEEENPLLRPVPAKSGGVMNSSGKGVLTGGGGLSSITTTKTLMERIEYNNSILAVPHHLPTHVVITPSKAGESKVLLPLLYVPTLGVTFEYHRRRYYLNQDEDTEEVGGEWIKIRCNTTMPLNFFQTWSGMSSTHQLEAAGVRFGENKFDVRQPTFKEMYKKQLLSPFTVFQLFCVVLWMLDDYW